MKHIVWLILLLGGINCGCRCNPVGPGNYRDPTKFTWTVDTIAYPGSFQTIMTSTWGASAADMYVAGFNSEDAGMMYHFDGKSWTRVPISVPEGGPIQGSLALSSVFGFSSGNIWAAGNRADSINQSTGSFYLSPLIIHWDGSVWSEITLSNIELSGGLDMIHGLSSGDVWSAGNAIYHYDGTRWSKADVPVPAQGMGFSSIAEVGPNDVYAVGFIRDVTPPSDTGSYYLYHYNGSVWRMTDSVVITSSYVSELRFGEKLFAVKGILYSSFVSPIRVLRNGMWSDFLNVPDVLYLGGNDANNLYAIGTKGTAYWYDGSSWTRLDIPGSSGLTFNAVWTDGNETFIVGDDGRRSYVYHGK